MTEETKPEEVQHAEKPQAVKSEVKRCPVCQGLWFGGECYKCGAWLDEAGQLHKATEPEPVPAPEPAGEEPEARSEKRSGELD